MPLAVLLVRRDGSKEFVDNVHVHGLADGHLLLARGEPGAGLSADVAMRVPLTELDFVETRKQDDNDIASTPWWLDLPK